MATQQGDNISRDKRVTIDKGDWHEGKTKQVNLLDVWE